MKKILFVLSLMIAISACGYQSDTQYSATQAEVEQASNDAAEIADLLASFGEVNLQTTSAGISTREQVINGKTGTMTISMSKEINEDGVSKTRTVAFKDFTRSDGKGQLTNINGTITYTFSNDKGNVKRTATGELTAIKNGEQVTLTIDMNFERDPTTGCISMSGSMNHKGKKVELKSKTHCKSDT